MSVSGIVFEERPIFMKRPVTDTGGIITGGAAHVGKFGITAVMRSCTSWRECRMSVPGLNRSSIDERSESDFDRSRSSPGTPLSSCSMGTVTSASTSWADSPRQMVWISARWGANSGKTSTGMPGTCRMPKMSIAAASTSTMKRNFRLVPTIQRIMTGAPLPVASLFLELELGPVQLFRAHRHDVGPGRQPVGQHRHLAVDEVDLDAVAHEHQRLGARVRPGVPFRVVEDRGVGNHVAQGAPDLHVAGRGGLEIEPLRRVLRQGHAGGLHTVEMLDLRRAALFGGDRLFRLLARRQRQACREKGYQDPTALLLHCDLPDLS